MNSHEIIAKSTKLGDITREFKGSLETFSKNVKEETVKIDDAITTAGDTGWSGELYNSFRDKFNEKIAELKKLTKRADELAMKLDQKAEKYDQIVAYYRKAGL